MRQDKVSVHDEPAWRERSDFIIHAPLLEADRIEQLWVRQLDSNRFEVCCIPFFLYDLALGDVVETRVRGSSQYVLHRKVKDSGRYVFRVFFESSRLEHRPSVVQQLQEMGALVESSSRRLIAVDARDLSHAQKVADYLNTSQHLGLLLYETGRS